MAYREYKQERLTAVQLSSAGRSFEMLLCGAPGIIQLTLALSVGLTIAGDALRVATFNIRQQAEGKTIKGASNTEEHDWRERRDGLLKQLIEAELHAISLQETAPWQKAWLEDQLSRKSYKAVPSDSEVGPMLETLSRRVIYPFFASTLWPSSTRYRH